MGSKVQKGEMKTCQWLLFSLLNVFSLQIPSTFNSQFQGKQVFCFPLLLLSKGKKKNLWFVYIGCWSQILVFNWPWKRVNSNLKLTENKAFDQQIQPIQRKTQILKISQSGKVLSFWKKKLSNQKPGNKTFYFVCMSFDEIFCFWFSEGFLAG